MEFVKIEMLFHAKALEVYTDAFRNLEMIDEEEHIEVSCARFCYLNFV